MLGEKCLQRGQGGGHKQGNSDARVVSLFVYCGIWCCKDAERILAIKAIRFVKICSRSLEKKGGFGSQTQQEGFV